MGWDLLVIQYHHFTLTQGWLGAGRAGLAATVERVVTATGAAGLTLSPVPGYRELGSPSKTTSVYPI
ncbi:hypothetical protein FC50_GL000766 [Lacticaseibacillus pantheris DSM 15945 = JCM 12539 = NBRC 106106]|uniref:Uncharacterized protein n=1 Tax=Lacticaseibacillus pantheris DSM 15945 = JCM 12539 = NBRC 106106 TaxID=1423783 RepID=A0A0R1U645_9LACO|nr:hypothetical protein FC50_GL000766 [Lacticaseibacillus pantheris DSM 15945 = JCM 12539 = NBRC 106106]